MQKQNSINDLREKIKSAQQGQPQKPKLCKVCNRASFLKCMECDTIYCSSKCQIKDWENHQYQHQHQQDSSVPSQKAPQKKESVHKAPSVQYRLKKAAEKEETKTSDQDIKRVLEEQIKKCDQIQQQIKSETSSTTESSRTVAKEEEIDQIIKKMQEIRSFKRSMDLDPSLQDSEGFSHVVVTEAEQNVEGVWQYSVMPLEAKESYTFYKAALAEAYKSDDIHVISMENLPRFKKNLVMTEIEGEWVRANILNISRDLNVVGLEDIDTGRQTIAKLPRDVVKVPLEEELHKEAYSFKVIFEELGEKLEKGDIVKIKILQQIPYSFSWALIKTQDVPSPDNSPKESPLESPKSLRDFLPKSNRLKAHQVQVKDMHCGPNTKVLYLDGSNLQKGLLHVCEALPEAWHVFELLSKEIKEHVARNPCTKSYIPEPEELVLAKFTDGLFYRAAALECFDNSARLFFIDYGSITIVNYDDMMAFPVKLLYTCSSHACRVRLASGKPLTSLDIDATNNRLMDQNEFAVKMEKESNHYYITLDDSIVVYK